MWKREKFEKMELSVDFLKLNMHSSSIVGTLSSDYELDSEFVPSSTPIFDIEDMEMSRNIEQDPIETSKQPSAYVILLTGGVGCG